MITDKRCEISLSLHLFSPRSQHGSCYNGGNLRNTLPCLCGLFSQSLYKNEQTPINLCYLEKSRNQGERMNNQHPSPQTLQWLAIGQFANRFQRSIRVWLLLNKLYGNNTNWAKSLPQTFTYAELRDKLFAPTHPTSEQLKQQITAQCQNNYCICHQTSADIVFAPENRQSEPQWLVQTITY